MAITPSQLSSILRVKKEFNLISGNITLTDLTNWSGENIIAPDTASVLLKLVSPTGAVVYQNIGYDTNNFGSPDFTLTTSVVSKTMPQDVNGNYITGTYTLYIKAQVTDDTVVLPVIEIETYQSTTITTQSDNFTISNTVQNGFQFVFTIDSGETITVTYNSAGADVATQIVTAINNYIAANPASIWAQNVSSAIYVSPTALYFDGLNFGAGGLAGSYSIQCAGVGTFSGAIQQAGLAQPQINSYFLSGLSDLTAGDVVTLSYSTDTITYTAPSAVTVSVANLGIYNAVHNYIVANPTSPIALAWTDSFVSGALRLTYNVNNVENEDPVLSYQHSYGTQSSLVTTPSAVETTAFVCDCTAIVSIEVDVDYATAVITTTDTTSYGAYSSITRTHTIYPPPLSGLPNQTTNATTNVYSNIVTTTWSVKITSDVTYLNTSDTYTTCRLVGSKEVVVEADTLCNTLCLIKKFRTEFYSKYGKKCVDEMEKAYNLAMDEFYLAFMATRCGRPQTEVQAYINKIYEITGLDPDCDCGCNAGEYPTPVVPTSIINGTDGTDGVTPQFQNTGTWIQVSYDSGNTWNNLFSLASVTGAAGANGTNGTNGADGVAVLENDLTSDTTTNAGVETLKTYQLSAGQLASNGDMIEIRVRFTAADKNTGTTTGDCYVFLGATQLTLGSILGSTIYGGYHVIRISRTGATAGKSDYEIQTRSQIGIQGVFVGLNSVAPTWANAIDIYVKADDNGGEAITCDLFQVTYYKA